MHDAHSHSAAQAGSGRLAIVVLLTSIYLLIEIAGGILTGSLALIADAGHMFTDVAGTTLALVAIRFAARPADSNRTYGYHRLEMLAAMANGALLFGIGLYILYEAYRRFTDPPDIVGLPMLAVASVGLLVNLLSAYLLMEGQKSSLNIRGAYLEVISDLLSSVAVIVAGLIILLTGFQLIDPIASAFIGLFILPRTWHLMREAIHVLLEGAPRNIDLADVRSHILGTASVTDVHDLHVWSMTSGMPIMSAHVVIEPSASASRVLDDLTECLGEHFDIEHSTLQIEHADRRHSEHAGH